MALVVSPQTGNQVNAPGDALAAFLAAGWRRIDEALDAAPVNDPAPGMLEPRGNASVEIWEQYAAALGIEVPEGAKRDEIRALVSAAQK